EREGQKAIVIGEGGSMLRTIGRMAREELETRFGRKVFLELWVKQREGWADDPRQLRQLGIDEQCSSGSVSNFSPPGCCTSSITVIPAASSNSWCVTTAAWRWWRAAHVAAGSAACCSPS